MARLDPFRLLPAGKRNRTAVTRVRSVTTPGGRTITVKRIPTLMPLLPRAAVDVTATTSRVLCEEGRELILDRLYAAVPQISPRPGVLPVPRPPRKRKPGAELADRTPFPHEPLSEPYAKRKAREGLDGRILIREGDYTNAIEVFRGEQVKGGVYYMVRLKPGKHYSGFTYNELARLLELGSSSKKLPARPHWGPTIRAVVARFRQLRPDVQAATLRQALERLS